MNRRHTASAYLALVEPDPGGAARHRALVGLHRRLPGRDRGRFRRHARADRGGRLRLGLLLHVLAPPRHPGRRLGRPGRARGHARAARPPPGAFARSQRQAFNRATVGRVARRADRQARPPRRADRRPHALSSRPSISTAPRPSSDPSSGSRSWRVGPNSLDRAASPNRALRQPSVSPHEVTESASRHPGRPAGGRARGGSRGPVGTPPRTPPRAKWRWRSATTGSRHSCSANTTRTSPSSSDASTSSPMPTATTSY